MNADTTYPEFQVNWIRWARLNADNFIAIKHKQCPYAKVVAITMLEFADSLERRFAELDRRSNTLGQSEGREGRRDG